MASPLTVFSAITILLVVAAAIIAPAHGGRPLAVIPSSNTVQRVGIVVDSSTAAAAAKLPSSPGSSVPAVDAAAPGFGGEIDDVPMMIDGGVLADIPAAAAAAAPETETEFYYEGDFDFDYKVPAMGP